MLQNRRMTHFLEFFLIDNIYERVAMNKKQEVVLAERVGGVMRGGERRVTADRGDKEQFSVLLLKLLFDNYSESERIYCI